VKPDTAEPVVYIVDDDLGVRQMIARMVRSVGLRAESFGCVPEFLDHFDPAQAGCLVLDVRMPGQSGLELQDHLGRADLHLPVIFITGHGDIPMSVRAMKGGAVDFIEKPFRDQVLLDAIHTALARDADQRVTGLLNKQVAAQLGTTEQTIKLHRGRVMRKMGAESLAQLVLLAQLSGAMDPPP